MAEIYEYELFGTNDDEFKKILQTKKSSKKIQIGIDDISRLKSPESNWARLSKLTELEDFCVGDVSIDLTVLKRCPKLKKLCLFYALIPSDDILSSLPLLEELYIYDLSASYHLTNAGFINMTNLRKLDLLVDCMVTNDVFSNFPQLKHLGLELKRDFCQIDDDFCDYVPNIRSLKIIRSEKITGKKFHKLRKLIRLELNDKIINNEYIYDLKNLRTLKIGLFNYTHQQPCIDARDLNLAGIAKHKTLEMLNLEDFPVVEKLYEIASFKNLKYLILPSYYNFFDKPEIDLTKILSKLTGLKMLHYHGKIDITKFTNLEFLSTYPKNNIDLSLLPNLKYFHTRVDPDSDIFQKIRLLDRPLTIFYSNDSNIYFKIKEFKSGIHTFIRTGEIDEAFKYYLKHKKAPT